MKKSTMHMTFEGANGTVTGSCTRLTYSCGGEQVQLLVDCGLRQESEEGDLSKPEWSFEPKSIHSVLLTHAHIDHAGALPLLYLAGFTGRVFATEATRDLCVAMLGDVAKSTGFYEKTDVEKIHWMLVDRIESGRNPHGFIPVANGIRTCFLRSSHILGASSVYVQWFHNVAEAGDDIPPASDDDYANVGTVFFSGDIGRTFDGINPESTFLKPNMFPYKGRNNVFFVLESTYGARTHAPHTGYAEKIDFLEQTLRRALEKKRNGYMVIPAFALDRTQTVLGDLYDVLMTRKIFQPHEVDEAEVRRIQALDIKKKDADKQIAALRKEAERGVICHIHSVSPLGIAVSKIYAHHLGIHGKYMDAKGCIKFRYTNARAEIPAEYAGTATSGDGNVVSDAELEARLSCLALPNRGYKGENMFLVTNEMMFEQKRVGGFMKSVPRDVRQFLVPHSVVVGASGMCDKGFIQPAVAHALCDSAATILLTGFTPKGSAGEVLKRFAGGNRTGGFSPTELFNRCVPGTDIRLYQIKADIVDMADFYSAHADSDGIVTYVFDDPEHERERPVQVFLNHGTPQGGLALAERLDRFNEQLADAAHPAPKTIITSPYCRTFDISDNTARWIDSDAEKLSHEELLRMTAETATQETQTAATQADNSAAATANAVAVTPAPQAETTQEEPLTAFVRTAFFATREHAAFEQTLGADAAEAIAAVFRRTVPEDFLADEAAQKPALDILEAWCAEVTTAAAGLPAPSDARDFLQASLAQAEPFTAATYEAVVTNYRAFPECTENPPSAALAQLPASVGKDTERLAKRLSDSLRAELPLTEALRRRIDRACRAQLKALLQEAEARVQAQKAAAVIALREARLSLLEDALRTHFDAGHALTDNGILVDDDFARFVRMEFFGGKSFNLDGKIDVSEELIEKIREIAPTDFMQNDARRKTFRYAAYKWKDALNEKMRLLNEDGALTAEEHVARRNALIAEWIGYYPAFVRNPKKPKLPPSTAPEAAAAPKLTTAMESTP